MTIIQDLKRLLSIPATPETFKRKVSEIVAKYDNAEEAIQEQDTPAEAPAIEEEIQEAEEAEESQAE